MILTKEILIKIIRVIITILILGGVCVWGFKSGSLEMISRANPIDLLLACFFQLFAFTILLFRWHLLLNINSKCKINSLVPSYYIGIFTGHLLPGNLGGDFVRSAYLFKAGIPATKLIVSCIVDRIIGILASLAICLIAIYISVYDDFLIKFKFNFILISISSLAIMLIVVYLLTTKLSFVYKSKLLKNDWIVKIKSFEETIQNFRKYPFVLLKAINLSLLSTLSVITSYFVLSQALDLNVTFNTLCIIVPISFFASSLPISIGGHGVREGVIIYLISLFGTPYDQGLSLNLLYILILTAAVLPCGIFLTQKTKSIAFNPTKTN
jgi:uncharacterized protein (TIRG00374 family)